MRRLLAILCSASLMAALAAGCSGSVTAPQETAHPGTGTQPGTSSSTATPPATPPTGAPGEAARTLFPLTITRTGGVAGFRDRLVVAAGGLVSISRGGQKPRRCQLTGPALNRLSAAASRVPWSKVRPTSREPSFPDDMVTTVQSPAGGPVSLEDPLLVGGRRGLVEVLDYLSDAQGSGPCAPV
jgi:hypothetical protein